jgi:hypothetical protein
LADWLTPDDVGAYLDLAPALVAGDDNLALATAAVKAAVERRRSDLWNRTAEPADFEPGDEVRGGAIMWAALVYQARNAPSGYAGYGDETMIFDSLGARRAEVMRLVGWRRPVAR